MKGGEWISLEVGVVDIFLAGFKQLGIKQSDEG